MKSGVQKRTKRLYIRLTDDEMYAIIQKKGVQTVSKYVRELLLGVQNPTKQAYKTEIGVQEIDPNAPKGWTPEK